MNKSLVALGLAFIAAAAVATASAGVLHEEVNKFNGVQTIDWRPIPEKPEAWVFQAGVGILEDGERYFVSASLLTYGDKWRFMNCNHIYWLIDGERVTDVKTRYEASPGSNAAIEYIRIENAEQVLPRFAAAKKVEFQVCGVDAEISAADLAGVRELLNSPKVVKLGLAGNGQ